MNVFVYSMRDIKSDFMAPTYSSNDAVAMRNFESAIEQSHDVLFTHRSDLDRKSTRLNSSHRSLSRMPSSA